MKEKKMKGLYFFWITFGASLCAMAYLYNAFLLNLLIALLLCVSTYFLKNFFDHYISYNWLSSLFCTLVPVILFAIPMVFVVIKGIDVLSTIEPSSLNQFIESTKEKILFWLIEISPEIASRAKEFMSNFSGSVILNYVFGMSAGFAKWGVTLLVNIGFIIVFLYFCFFYSKAFRDFTLNLIPFSVEQTKSIYEEISGVLNIVFFTSILNILLQGFCFGVASYFLGYDGFLLGVLYGFASIVPVVGGALVWVPVAFYQLYLGDTTGAIFIALYGAIFIGLIIDNGVKPLLIGFVKDKVIKTSVKINEVLIFFAILAGISVFGFAGIVIGPAATALFIALLRVYDNSLKN
ncbi:AI-2E family transporter [Helicobacter cholecystus]|uniref:AI-2E family transporter n=2 Tax=Helicobacter cholecystus TaxID=45498 RepID=A0A3D8IXC7_9HELI|nr:AI-2E family transporter [Helicobacter cholecystus]VEJ25035.1 acid membrane antigen A [Helicobacter cholecystus]